MADIRLIATDLDGTLLGPGTSIEAFDEFRERLADLRARANFAWVISTGRSIGSFRRVYRPMQLLNLQPDYTILRHAYIYSVTRWGFFPHRIWNFWVRLRVWRDRAHVFREMIRWHKVILLTFPGVKTVARKRTRLCLRFRTDETAASACRMLRDKAASYRHLQIFHYMKEVDVRSVPFTKGLAVAELAAHLGLAPDQVLAIGDGHNDVSMFDPAVAGLCGCPSNAAPEIMALVHERNGHIAGAPSLAGVIEVLHAFAQGEVCSELPADWKNPTEMQNPVGPPKKPPKKKGGEFSYVKLALFVLTVYTTILVLASFKMFPHAEWVMKPYRLLESFLTMMMDKFM